MSQKVGKNNNKVYRLVLTGGKFIFMYYYSVLPAINLEHVCWSILDIYNYTSVWTRSAMLVWVIDDSWRFLRRINLLLLVFLSSFLNRWAMSLLLLNMQKDYGVGTLHLGLQFRSRLLTSTTFEILYFYRVYAQCWLWNVLISVKTISHMLLLDVFIIPINCWKPIINNHYCYYNAWLLAKRLKTSIYRNLVTGPYELSSCHTHRHSHSFTLLLAVLLWRKLKFMFLLCVWDEVHKACWNIMAESFSVSASWFIDENGS